MSPFQNEGGEGDERVLEKRTRAREQQQQVVKENIRKGKQVEAELRSEVAAPKIMVEHELAAQEQLKII